MNSAAELRRSIETCRLSHVAYDEHYRWLKDRIDDALDGFSPRIEGLIGPSRAGKSMLLEALEQDYPAKRVDGVRDVPVLRVKLPPAITPKLFPAELLKALKVPIPAKVKTSGELLGRVCEQFKLAGTRVLLLDEASHFVEPGARVPPRAAGDMVKSLSDDANLSIFATGIPHLERLFQSNEQLRLRASARRMFKPYNFAEAEDRMAFAQCVRTYADLFDRYGWPIDMDFAALVKQCYFHCGGLIGVLSAFMRELCIRKRGESPRPLTLADCLDAAQRAEGTGHALHKPFQSEEVSAAELNQAYGYVLETYGLPTRGKR
ncbi:MAG: TniB family NTP-binding protein [Roseateles sp.]|uniref:TniB family NTP-binding protein n=1 Tax=Roseateles sp. TaxID=1971397 RepID=UPI0039ECFEAD